MWTLVTPMRLLEYSMLTRFVVLTFIEQKKESLSTWTLEHGNKFLSSSNKDNYVQYHDAFPVYSLLFWLPIAVTKCLTRSNLGNGGFDLAQIWDHSPSWQGSSWRQEQLTGEALHRSGTRSMRTSGGMTIKDRAMPTTFILFKPFIQSYAHVCDRMLA